MLVRLEQDYERSVRECSTLDRDSFNFAQYCWRDMDGAEDVKKNLKVYKAAMKKNKEKKSTQAEIKKKHTKTQASLV